MANRFTLKNGGKRGIFHLRRKVERAPERRRTAKHNRRKDDLRAGAEEIEALTDTVQKVSERVELMAPARRAGALRQQIFSATKTEVCLSVQIIR